MHKSLKITFYSQKISDFSTKLAACVCAFIENYNFFDPITQNDTCWRGWNF